MNETKEDFNLNFNHNEEIKYDRAKYLFCFGGKNVDINILRLCFGADGFHKKGGNAFCFGGNSINEKAGNACCFGGNSINGKGGNACFEAGDSLITSLNT